MEDKMFCEVYIFLPIHSVIAAHHLSWLWKVGSLNIERAPFCHYCRMILNVPLLKIIPCLTEPSSIWLSLIAYPYIRRPKTRHLWHLFLSVKFCPEPSPSCFVFASLFYLESCMCPQTLTATNGSDPKLSSPTMMTYFPTIFPTSSYCRQSEKPSFVLPGHNIHCKPLWSL